MVTPQRLRSKFQNSKPIHMGSRINVWRFNSSIRNVSNLIISNLISYNLYFLYNAVTLGFP